MSQDKKIENGLNPVEVNLSAELGKANLTVDDFLKLGRGDIIKLDNKCTNPIKLYVEDQEYYYVKPGIVGKNIGVAVLDVIDKDVNE
jgi:flagellar motor switch protein FliM